MTSLQEQQARAREESVSKWVDTPCRGILSHEIEFMQAFLDSLIARVRTETLDAVEAGMPSKYGNGDNNAVSKSWNACRDVALAHLRTLRDIKS